MLMRNQIEGPGEGTFQEAIYLGRLDLGNALTHLGLLGEEACHQGEAIFSISHPSQQALSS